MPNSSIVDYKSYPLSESPNFHIPGIPGISGISGWLCNHGNFCPKKSHQIPTTRRGTWVVVPLVQVLALTFSRQVNRDPIEV